MNAGKLDAVFDTNKVAAVLEKYGAQAWQGLADPIIVWMYESGNDSGSFVGGELLLLPKLLPAAPTIINIVLCFLCLTLKIFKRHLRHYGNSGQRCFSCGVQAFTAPIL